MDGTDCEIQEPTDFDPTYYSHKFNKAGLRYELAVSIQTGWIVWVNGPFRCGSYPDANIFLNEGLLDELPLNERVEVDGGYRGHRAFSGPNDTNGSPEWGKMKAEARARHETINGRLKRFAILSTTYRGDRDNHGLFFYAVAAIVQFDIRRGGTSFIVDYMIRRRNNDF